jgi:hypothetical protein
MSSMSAHVPRRAAVAAATCIAVAGGAIVIAGTTGGHVLPAARFSAASTTTVPKAPPHPRFFPGGKHRGFPGFRFGGPLGAFGTVGSVTAGGFTVKGPGATYTYTTSSSTVYREASVPVGRGALAAGERVLVRAEAPASSGATHSAAHEVEIVLPAVTGKVVSISGSQVVVEDGQGFWRTVAVSSSTAYGEAGKKAAASALKAGDYVVAMGLIAADHTTLDASAVGLLGTTPAEDGGGGFPPAPGFFDGPGFFGGDGPGMMGGPATSWHPMGPPQAPEPSGAATT